MQMNNKLTDAGGRLIAKGLKGNCSVTKVKLVSCRVFFVCLVLLTFAGQYGNDGMSDAVARELHEIAELNNKMEPEQRLMEVAAIKKRFMLFLSAHSCNLVVYNVHGCCADDDVHSFYYNCHDSSVFPLHHIVTQKYDLLMCSAPAVDFDCSGLYNPRHLLKVVTCAAREHAGQPGYPLAFAFSTLTPCSAATASVKSINLGYNWLTPTISVELQQLLHRFHTLQHVNVSGNFSLGCDGVTVIVSSLAGA
jgi:hypothetical protein